MSSSNDPHIPKSATCKESAALAVRLKSRIPCMLSRNIEPRLLANIRKTPLTQMPTMCGIRLTDATRTESEGHEGVGVAALSLRGTGKEALRAEHLRLRPIPGVVLDAPDVDVHPRALGQAVAAHLPGRCRVNIRWLGDSADASPPKACATAWRARRA